MKKHLKILGAQIMKPEPLLIVNCSCFMKKHCKTYQGTSQDPNLEATQFGQKNSAVRFAKQLDQSFCNLKPGFPPIRCLFPEFLRHTFKK